MQVSPDIHLPPAGRDYRLDVLRGIANWAIFLDHIPNNVVNWVTTRNYGFSDAADLFIFISGWTVAFVYGRMMINRGYIIAATRIGKRAWQIYVAHLVLFVMYIAEVGYLAKTYNDADILPHWLYVAFIPNDKTNLDPSRIVHFVIGTFFIIRYVPRDWSGFQRPIFQPMIRCGQQSLEVFCFGIFLAGAAHIILVKVSNAIWMQVLVSVAGIVLMTILAYYRSWSKRLDKPTARAVPAASPAVSVA
jgi:hypothetical protein